MKVIDTPRDNQNSMFLLNKNGNRMKNNSDGITSQKIPWDKLAILTVSFVSMKIQTKASSERIGIDAKMLPANVLLFEISEIATMVTDESNTLIM